jgi:hypothetical protein
MSIAHSIMLLVTLLFVLTTRGITLDFNSAVRTGVRADIHSPVSSPTVKRPSSMLFAPPEHSDHEGLLPRIGDLRNLEGSIRGYQTSGEYVRSAPASPSGVSRAWNSSSSKHQIRPLSQHGDARVVKELQTEGDSLSEDRLSVTERDSEIDYPTPESSMEE